MAGERNRAISVLKSRGTAHSNQIREFVMSNARPDPDRQRIATRSGFVTGSAREAQQEHDTSTGKGNGSANAAA